MKIMAGPAVRAPIRWSSDHANAIRCSAHSTGMPRRIRCSSGLTLEHLIRRGMPVEWAEQRMALAWSDDQRIGARTAGPAIIFILASELHRGPLLDREHHRHNPSLDPERSLAQCELRPAGVAKRVPPAQR